jgi:hypothetical protein
MVLRFSKDADFHSVVLLRCGIDYKVAGCGGIVRKPSDAWQSGLSLIACIGCNGLLTAPAQVHDTLPSLRLSVSA